MRGRRRRGGRGPLLTLFEDRWEWIDNTIVPRFRRYEAHPAARQTHASTTPRRHGTG